MCIKKDVDDSNYQHALYIISLQPFSVCAWAVLSPTANGNYGWIARKLDSLPNAHYETKNLTQYTNNQMGSKMECKGRY